MFTGSAVIYRSGINNQIYTTLVKLHKNELVTLEVELHADSPSGKIYSITAKGQAELKNGCSPSQNHPNSRILF
jgi:PadR family transcriptional regulator AphA